MAIDILKDLQLGREIFSKVNSIHLLMHLHENFVKIVQKWKKCHSKKAFQLVFLNFTHRTTFHQSFLENIDRKFQLRKICRVKLD